MFVERKTQVEFKKSSYLSNSANWQLTTYMKDAKFMYSFNHLFIIIIFK